MWIVKLGGSLATDDALRASFTRADPVAEVYHRLGHRPRAAALGQG